MKTWPLVTAVAAALVALNGSTVPAAPGDTSVTPGELVIEHPTLINLGFEWHIDGDANRNASVAVSFRKQGDTAWRAGMPLLRIQNERVYQPNVFNLVSPNMFAGSILDLEPGTAYEARLVMTDPDGINGAAADATRIVTVRTRPEPQPAEGGKVYHVYPTKWKGPKIEPAFEGIMCAYNYYCGAGDTAPGGRPRVKPGDVILVHAGIYAYHYEFYANQTTVNATTTFEGTYYLTADGTPEKPIVIKAAGDGEVVLDGRSNFNLINVKAADYTYFEGITFRNTDIAIWGGTQFIAGSKGLTVKRCRFEDVGMGVFTNYSGSSDYYIADSVFLGRNDHTHLTGWNGQFWQQFEGVDGQEFPPVMKSYTGIRLYGPGHVVAHNYVADFHDGIDTEMYGMPDGSHPIDGPSYPPREYWDRRPTAIDVYNNYITNAHDNSIEMDGSMHNIRLMRNMLINSASHPISTQPSVGGPIYWIRNIAYNAPGGSTRLTAGSPGVVYYNNTILTETGGNASANVHWRNNLMLPQNALPAIFSVTTSTNYSSSDYNGFGLNPGAEFAFQWSSPPWDVTAVDATAANPVRLEQRRYKTLEEYSRATKQDQHSLLVDYDVFVKVSKLDAKDLVRVQRLYKAEDLDFRLKPGSAAIDRGVAIPNVTDGFTGRAPDLGALEAGQPLPVYGPRSVAVAQAAPEPPQPPAASEIAVDTYFVPGAVPEDRGPDGNTVILVAPAGLIAIDTGRHPWHTEAILAFARDRRRPVAAIVNTHWHLDHSSGNRRVKAAHPQAKLYATRAVDRALAPGGMLARNLAAARARQPDPNASAIRREETALFSATMDAADALRADVPVSESGTRSIAGRRLSVRVAADAVTDADLWLYDEATGVAIIGDLVTLPAPFFETACPARWQQALDEVWATPFRLAVPGHGAPMTRDQFNTYRRAFAGFRTCVGSDSTAAVCAAGWTRDVSSLLSGAADRREASEYATYYVDFLRKNSGASPDCRVK